MKFRYFNIIYNPVSFDVILLVVNNENDKIIPLPSNIRLINENKYYYLNNSFIKKNHSGILIARK